MKFVPYDWDFRLRWNLGARAQPGRAASGHGEQAPVLEEAKCINLA